MSRPQVVAEVRRDLAAARGAARAALAGAETAAAHARHERDDRQATHDERLARLAAARERGLRAVTGDYRERVIGLGRQLDALAMRGAPGPAGASWRTWRAADGHPAGQPPLLRIGAIHVERALPALVPLLGRAHLWLTGHDTAAADGVIAGLLLRTLGGAAPGEVAITVYDPEHLGDGLAAFAPLRQAGLLGVVGPGGLAGLLDELVEELCRPAAGARAWRLAVLLVDPVTAADIPPAQRAQLDRIVRTGADRGVHLVVRGLPAVDHPRVCHLALHDADATCTATGELPVRLDPPPPADLVARACAELAARARAGPPPAALADLAPPTLWTESSAYGLAAPLGDAPDGSLVEVALGDDPPHALVAGPSGAGKTNLLFAWLAALCARYSPDELALHLLDCSGGGSFARCAATRRDPSWLPQARAVGLDLGAHREAAVAMLADLAGELRRREQAARRHEAAKLAELRAEDPGGRWPRVLAVIDDLQALLARPDPHAARALALLGDLARGGRSQGIHLVLAVQDVAGVGALSERPALLAQFTLRIALPKAHRVLADGNLAADVIPRFHAVVNAASGVPAANRVVRLPDAGDRAAWRRLQQRLWRRRPAGLAPPRLFDGQPAKALPAAVAPRPAPAGVPVP